MAGLIRTLFRSKKNKKDAENDDDYAVFQPCVRSTSLKRQPTARFSDDHMLPATAAYHTKSAPKLKKGPQSCPGGNLDDDDESFDNLNFSRKKSKNFQIDADFNGKNRRPRHKSRQSLREPLSGSDDSENDRISMYEEKSQYYQRKYEESERQRKEERRKQANLERERNNIQNAMSNIAYCMASVQELEKLKKERDQYKKEMGRLRNKCEKLESKLENLASPGFFQPSPFQTPQYPPPLSFNYSNPITLPPQNFLHSRDFLNQVPQSSAQFPPPIFQNSVGSYSNTPTTIGSEGAGESLANPSEISFLRGNGNQFFDDDDGDEIKNYREESEISFAPTPFSELTQSTNTTN